jgi:hypothetical protein
MMVAMPSKTPEAVLAGSWKITTMEMWDQDYVDLVVPGFVRFDGETGELMFGVVRGDLACIYTTNRGQPYVKFAWIGESEWDPIQGTGRARLSAKGMLKGRISITHGDASTFEAERSETPLAGYRPGPKWGRRR